MAATRMSLTSTDDAIAGNENENLPSLLSRLGDDVMQLINSQLALFKVEIKEEANTYAHGAMMIGLGGVIAAIGFGLLNVAIAFGISTLFAQMNISQPAAYALGFVITGVFYLVVGAVVVMAMKSRLAKQTLVPNRTVEELRKDKQWLKNEI